MATSADQEIRDTFARRLQIERRNLGLTQEQLADQIGRSVDLISRLERSTTGPSLETIALLSKVFGIEPAAMLTFNGVQNARFSGPIAEIIDLVLLFPDGELERLKRVLNALR